MSLDVFRGMTIAGMILVNDPGSWSHVYSPLRHAKWHGVTPTDFVFPFFVFIVGVSIVLAYSKRQQRGDSLTSMLGKIVWRTAAIFGLGLLLQLVPKFDFTDLRYAGVLQRIAIVFFACSLLFFALKPRGLIALCSTLLIGYCIVMSVVPVPIDDVIQDAIESGTVMSAAGDVELTPLTVHDKTVAANLQPGTNLAAWIDRAFLPGRLWEKTWDPEGLLSSLPAIATGILGMLIGWLLLTEATHEQRVANSMVIGFLCFVAGAAWNWFFPFNKNLWSSSFVLYTSGLATMTLGALYWLIDLKNYHRWAFPFRVFGCNAIAAYVLHGLIAKLVTFFSGGWRLSSPFMQLGEALGIPPELASLSYAISYTALVYLFVWGMYRRKIFLRV